MPSALQPAVDGRWMVTVLAGAGMRIERLEELPVVLRRRSMAMV
ncbi:hypothetical protein ACGFIF_27180 [Kribbella sp. NPDC049174]